MAVAELLALPAGQRLRWDDWGLGGVVATSGGGRLIIFWNDGQESVISPDDGDTDLSEFAAGLDRVEEADEPVIIDRGT